MKKKSVFTRVGILLILLIGLVKCSEPKKDEIKPVVINGEPRFIIGSYHNPNDLDELKTLAENGFNLIRSAAEKEALDMVKEAGLNAWLVTGYSIDFSKDKIERKEKLTDLVTKFKDHPALAVWEVPDEALWNIGYPKLYSMFYDEKHWSVEQQDSILKVLSIAIPERAKGIAEGSELLKSIDSMHPIWMNHAPRNTLSQLKLFSKSADIVGCDIYPGKRGVHWQNDLHTHRMNSVGAFTDIMQKAAPGKPIWMVLPGFSWEVLELILKSETPTRENVDPKGFPTYKHSRYMAWNAILHGAKGILYWGTYQQSSKSLFFNSILGVTKEIAALEPFLLAPEMKEKINIDPIQFISSVKTRASFTLRKHIDDYLLVVLQEDLSQAVDVTRLDFIEGKTLYELTTDQSYVVKNGKIRVGFGKEPHVLCTSKKYDVVNESDYPLTWDKEDNFPLNEIE